MSVPVVLCPCGHSLLYVTEQGIDEGANRIALVVMTVYPCTNQYCTEKRPAADRGVDRK